MASRLILVATNAEADAFNAWMAEQLPGEMQVVLASNTVAQTARDNAVIPPEVLATLNPSCMPPHKLHLKPGVVLILLRNIDVDQGLCNGARLTLEQVTRHTLKCRILGGARHGNLALLPKLTFTPSDTVAAPCEFRRRPFPVRVAFALTINKSQGQTLDHVGVYLRSPIFAHGHLYVALSRCTDP